MVVAVVLIVGREAAAEVGGQSLAVGTGNPYVVVPGVLKAVGRTGRRAEGQVD